jgi:hypothetical protein
MFPIKRGFYWQRRRLFPPDDELFAGRAPDYAGPIPRTRELPSMTFRKRLRWGTELGARFRDDVRLFRRNGTEVDAWQFDEVVPHIAAPGAAPFREFTRGILRGVAFGRPILGDAFEPGFVWMASAAFALAERPVNPEIGWFWRTLNHAARALVGEEYPRFEGDPAAAARDAATGQRALAAGGPARRALARKYVPGMTPGYDVGGGLGGNVNGWPRAQVNVWRSRYLAARAASGVAGFAEFDFRSGNRDPTVMQDVLAELARYV